MGYADDLEAVSVDEALIDATSAVRSLRYAPDEEGEMPLHIRRAYGDDDVLSASPDNQEDLDTLKPRDWAIEVAQKIRDDVRAATGCEGKILR
jgi:DNA repair protein REV1